MHTLYLKNQWIIVFLFLFFISCSVQPSLGNTWTQGMVNFVEAPPEVVLLPSNSFVELNKYTVNQPFQKVIKKYNLMSNAFLNAAKNQTLQLQHANLYPNTKGEKFKEEYSMWTSGGERLGVNFNERLTELEEVSIFFNQKTHDNVTEQDHDDFSNYPYMKTKYNVKYQDQISENGDVDERIYTIPMIIANTGHNFFKKARIMDSKIAFKSRWLQQTKNIDSKIAFNSRWLQQTIDYEYYDQYMNQLAGISFTIDKIIIKPDSGFKITFTVQPYTIKNGAHINQPKKKVTTEAYRNKMIVNLRTKLPVNLTTKLNSLIINSGHRQVVSNPSKTLIDILIRYRKHQTLLLLEDKVAAVIVKINNIILFAYPIVDIDKFQVPILSTTSYKTFKVPTNTASIQVSADKLANTSETTTDPTNGKVQLNANIPLTIFGIAILYTWIKNI